jgi:hypothetical protein
MVKFGKRVGGGRRIASREKLPMPAMLSTIQHYHVAVLVDLSSTGARFRGDKLPPIDEVVSVKLDSVQAFGIVAWSRKNECGLSFDVPLSKFDLERLRHKIKVASLGWRNVDERMACDDWQTGLAR